MKSKFDFTSSCWLPGITRTLQVSSPSRSAAKYGSWHGHNVCFRDTHTHTHTHTYRRLIFRVQGPTKPKLRTRKDKEAAPIHHLAHHRITHQDIFCPSRSPSTCRSQQRQYWPSPQPRSHSRQSRLSSRPRTMSPQPWRQ